MTAHAEVTEVEVPPFHAFLRPALESLQASGQASAKDVIAEVARAMSLSDEQMSQTISSGQQRVNNRILWSLSYLYQAGAVERPQRGQYRITTRGEDLLQKHRERITVQDLRAFEEFLDFQTRTRASNTTTEVEDGDDLTPQEQIERASQKLDSSVAADLLERIRQQPPEFLEKAVVRLLVAMGYGGTHGDGQHLGGSGDGGFDGVINQDPLGLGRVYVQAKRYEAGNHVGRPAVQAFLGALHAEGAAGGVFITTSRFTAEAVGFAAQVSPRIILIDGPRLGELLVSYRIGVQERETFTVVDVDEDFFD